jgi:hypothetical protein
MMIKSAQSPCSSQSDRSSSPLLNRLHGGFLLSRKRKAIRTLGKERLNFADRRLNPSDVLNKVAGLAGYLIEHGNVLKDGDTFGGSEVERIKIKHTTSTRLAGAPILRVAAEGRGLGRDR